MKNWIKRILYTAILLLILSIAGLIAFISQINLNDYKGKITHLFFEKTGLHLVINGDIEWQIFPSAGLTVNDIDIANKSQKTLFKLQRATADLDIVPLFWRDISVNKILVNNMKMDIVKMVDGRFNFQDSVKPAEISPRVQSKPEDQTESSAGDEKKDFSFNIKSIQRIIFDNLNVSYKDQEKNQNFSVKNASLHATNLTAGNEFPLLMRFTVDSDQPKLKMDVNLKGLGVVDLKSQKYAIEELELTTKPKDAVGNDFTLSGNVMLKNERLLFNLNGSPLNLQDFLPANQPQADTMPANQHQNTVPASLPSANEKQSSVTTTAEMSNVGIAVIPVALIRALNMEGTLRLNSLKYNDLVFDHPEFILKAADGVAEIVNFKTGLYGGSVTAKMKIDTQQPEPDVAVSASAQGVEIKKLSPAKNIQGQAFADIRLLTRGEMSDRLLKQLNGEVSFHVEQGQFNSINVNRLVCEMVSKLQYKQSDQTTNKKEWPEGTQFRALRGKWMVNNGIASNNDLRATLDTMELRGDGWLNLINQTIDYHLSVTITGNSTDSSQNGLGCEINPRYADLDWPLRCRGKLGQPNLCGIDSERFGQLVQRVLQREAAYHVQKELKKYIKNPLKKIQGLFQ